MRTRLTLAGGAVVSALCLLFATSLLVGIHLMATDYLTDQVAATAGRVAHAVEQSPTRDPLAHSQIRHVQVVDRQGKVVMATKDLQGAPAMAHFRPKSAGERAVSVVCDKVFRLDCDIVAAVPVEGKQWIVYSAAPVIPPYVHPWLTMLLFGGALLLSAAITFTGYHLLGRTLRPVHAIRKEFDEIGAADLSRRVPVPPAQDEIHDLAESANRALERLQTAMERQSRFSSDASHELRTPLAALRAQVEDAMLAPEETDVAAMADALLPSLDRLQAIVTDLLTLSRLQAGTPVTRRPLDLAELVRTELNRRRWTKEIECRLSPGVVVKGDERGLGQLITDLMSNAVRHATRTVTVTVRREQGTPGDPPFPEGAAVLEVLDDGPGIAPDQREVIFQPFTRLDTARSRHAGGTGLGLPIARHIAEIHDGSLAIQDSLRGARFVLRLPLGQADADLRDRLQRDDPERAR